MITAVLEDFIGCWKMYNEQGTIDNVVAANRINNGDCGLTAVAVHYVLLHKYGIDTQITLNNNHCWLVLNDTDYDTGYPLGYPHDNDANAVWSRGDVGPVKPLDFKAACDEWMPCDSFGGYLVKAFVERYGLTMPAELQHCIDKAAEYESPERIPVLEGHYARTLRVPLAV